MICLFMKKTFKFRGWDLLKGTALLYSISTEFSQGTDACFTKLLLFPNDPAYLKGHTKLTSKV